MNNRSKLAISLIIGMLSIFISIFATTSGEIVLATFKDGKITKNEFKQKLNELPGFYRSKITSDKDKENFLDQLVIRKIFYMEAVNHGYADSIRVLKQVNDRLKNEMYAAYKNKYIKPEVKVTNKEKQDYYIKHTKDKAIFGKTFKEVSEYIEKKIIPEKEKKLEEKERIKLEKKYKVKYNTDVINKINLKDIDSNLSFANEKIVESPNQELSKTVGEFVEVYKKLPQYKRTSIEKDGLEKFIKELTKKELFYLEALAQGLDKNEQTQKNIERNKENAILQIYYSDIILNTIPDTDEAIKKYYDEHISEFSSRAERKIRAFFFKDEKTAKKIRKKVAKLLKQQKEDQIVKLLKKYSKKPEKDGVIEHIYKNKIVPGYGKDNVFYEKIWKTPSNKVSDIFKNNKGDYTFFYILEDKPEKPLDFENVKNRVRSVMRNKLAKEKFENLKKELYKKYNVQIFADKIPDILEAKEYFSKAMNAQNHKRYKDAIFYYDKIIKYYPNNKDDYKATFMKAYIYAENLGDKQKALELFKKLLKDFPKGELNDSAKFMIDELEGKSTLSKEFENN